MSNPEVAAAVQTAIDEAKERAANRSTAGKAEKALKFLADKRVQLLAEIVVATAVRQFPLKK